MPEQSLGSIMTQLNYHSEAKEAIDPIIDLAIKHNLEKKALPDIHYLGYISTGLWRKVSRSI